MQRFTGRRRVPGLLSLAIAIAALGATATTAHADLSAGAPTNITTGFFDDHSISGDNHAGWGPTEEPLAVRFNAAVANDATPISMCGTPAAAGWMAATAGPCGSGGAQFGWFRYITANHFGKNRWQLLDFQRFALVRVGTGETIWDTRWGTCVNASEFADCSRDPNAPQLANMGFLPNATKVTQDGADEDQIIAIPNQLGYRLPEGAWQLVHVVNPYGIVPGDTAAGNVACVRLTLTWDATPGPSASPLQLAARDGAEDCIVPAPPARVTGPGDPNDPMRYARAFPITCAPTATGHCWTTPPARCSEASPTARTYTSGTLVPATDPCAPGGGVGGASGTNPVQGLSRRARNLRITTRLSRRYASVALRKALRLRRTPTNVRRSCRVTSRVGARCSVRWSGSGRRVRGTVWLRFVAGSTANRWTYRVDLRSTRNGRTTRIRHNYRTGGRLL